MKRRNQNADHLYNYLKLALENQFEFYIFTLPEHTIYDKLESELRLNLWDDFAGQMFDASYLGIRRMNE